jgi:glycosyltransferase involved in cell wall biosynthesis
MNSVSSLISVVIVNRNYAAFLRESIESVLEQDYPNLELIVVDDHSTDNSWGIIESFVGRLVGVRTSGVGVAKARNIGVQECKGRYLAFLDSDDFWEPEKLSSQMKKFENAEVGAVYCGVRKFGESINPASQIIVPQFRGDCATYFRRWPMHAVILLASSGILVDRSKVDFEFWFNPKLSVSADWDLARRICDRTQVEFVENALVNYRIHNSNMSLKTLRTSWDWLRSGKMMIWQDFVDKNYRFVILGVFGLSRIFCKKLIHDFVYFLRFR